MGYDLEMNGPKRDAEGGERKKKKETRRVRERCSGEVLLVSSFFKIIPRTEDTVRGPKKDLTCTSSGINADTLGLLQGKNV
jgi:hypothetical protein